jgi:chemotaxis protein MotB
MKSLRSKRGKRRGSRATTENVESRDRWLISYADLVTLLLALFIVLYAAADQDRAVKIASAFAAEFNDAPKQPPTNPRYDAGSGVLPGSDSLVGTQASFDRAIAGNKDLRDRTRISMTERGLVVSLTEAGFFPPGDQGIREDALSLLDAVADVLNASNVQVRVEGHTDSTPISTSRYPSNWELSSARATTVLGYLVKKGVATSRLSVAGYAGERPIADNSTPEGRAMNRRVDLVILR